MRKKLALLILSLAIPAVNVSCSKSTESDNVNDASKVHSDQAKGLGSPSRDVGDTAVNQDATP